MKMVQNQLDLIKDNEFQDKNKLILLKVLMKKMYKCKAFSLFQEYHRQIKL